VSGAGGWRVQVQEELPRGAQAERHAGSGGSAVGWVAGGAQQPAAPGGGGGGGQVEWTSGLSGCWKRGVLEATCAADLMEALVLLEASVEGTFQKLIDALNTRATTTCKLQPNSVCIAVPCGLLQCSRGNSPLLSVCFLLRGLYRARLHFFAKVGKDWLQPWFVAARKWLPPAPVLLRLSTPAAVALRLFQV
jgi:hypothetical protein